MTSPIIISVDGNIGVGKSRFVSEILPRILGKEPFSFLEPENPWLNKFYENPKKYIIKLQHYFLASRLEVYAKVVSTEGEKYFILDRSIFSDVIFVNNALENGVMTKEDYDVFMKTREVVLRDLPLPNLVIYLDSCTTTCLERINKRGLECEKDIENNYLVGIEKNYANFVKEMEQKGVKVLTLNWENFEKAYTNEQLKKMITDCLQ